MSEGTRVQQLLDTHGHSYAEAEKMTGVSRETLRRICLGHRPPRLRMYLRQIATGYRVDELSLLEGMSPKAEFEWAVPQAPPAQRLEWFLLSPAQRLKVTLDFIREKYPNVLIPKVLATAAHMTSEEYLSLLERWEYSPPGRSTALDLAEAVSGLTGIPLSWFRWSALTEEWKYGATRLHVMATFTRQRDAGIANQVKQVIGSIQVWHQ